jgi:hypothetical protein
MAVNSDAIRTRVRTLMELLGGNTDDRAAVENACMGTIGILEILYGPTSPQVKAFQDGKKTVLSGQYTPSYKMEMLGQTVKGTLQNIIQEIDAGLVTTLSNQAAGEIFGDLVALAKEAHKLGHRTVAAVLACAALEDSLKRKADALGIVTSGKTLDQVVNALKAASFFKGPQGAIVGSYVKLRNSAMHADWDKIQDTDVGSLIGFLEPFLIQHYS